jgi:broad specificity phosphatase PhoE
MSKIYFFRHAQASYGAVNYDQLSAKGEQQSAVLGQYLVDNDFGFDKIYVGPMRRQQHTFEIVADVFAKNNRSMPEPILVEGLREHGGGSAMTEGLPQLLAKVPEVRRLFEEIKERPELKRKNSLLAFEHFMYEWADGNIVLEKMINWAEFRANVKTGLNYILKETNKGERVAAFTSGGTISAITAESLQLQNERRVAALNLSIKNTSFTSFLFSNEAFNLLSFNELPHLGKDLETYV